MVKIGNDYEKHLNKLGICKYDLIGQHIEDYPIIPRNQREYVASDIERVMRLLVQSFTINIQEWQGQSELSQWVNTPSVEKGCVIGVSCIGRIVKPDCVGKGYIRPSVRQYVRPD